MTSDEAAPRLLVRGLLAAYNQNGDRDGESEHANAEGGRLCPPGLRTASLKEIVSSGAVKPVQDGCTGKRCTENESGRYQPQSWETAKERHEGKWYSRVVDA